MKKRIFLAFILSFILIQSSVAFNEEKPFSLELEYFAPDEAPPNFDAMGAFGLRFTYLTPVSDNFEAGGSLGYIMGPSYEYNISVLGQTGSTEWDYSYLRLLGELKTEVSIGGDWIFKPGLSAGMAFGNLSYSNSVNGGAAGSATGSGSWSGFAWEISAPIVYDSYIFALKYAGFPSGENSDAWNTFGFSVGYRFGLNSGGGSSGRDYDDEYKPSAQEAKRDFEPSQNFEEEEEEFVPESYAGYVQQADELFSKEEYMEAAGKYTGALRFVGVNDPRRIYILERQATTLGKQEKYNEGIKLYMTAIKVGKKLKIVNRNVINAYLGLSYCLTKIGNIPWAIINYKSARKLTKSESLKLKIDQVLEGLQSGEVEE